MASSAVASAAQQLGALIAGEAKYLYDVSDKIERLQRDLEWMQCFLEDADNRQNKERVVAKWVAEIRDFAYEAEEIVEKYLCRVSRHRKDGKWNTIKWFSCVVCDIRALHDVGSSIDGLRTRISELTSRMQMFGIKMSNQSGISAYDIAMREQRRTYAHIEENPIGLEKDTEEVVDKLVNGECKVIGIAGMGGLGKTTLAKRVFHNADVRKCFKNNLVWLYISKQFNKKDIYQEILIGLSNISKDEEKDGPMRRVGMRKIKDLPEGDLCSEIFKTLKERECLVVLDDLWKTRDWDTLKPAFEGIKSSGSKILITTRDIRLIQYAGGYAHNVSLLTEEESWKLLLQATFRNWENRENNEIGTSQDLTRKSATTKQIFTKKTKEMVKDYDDEKVKPGEMLKHCNGLPLAIKALGGLLSNKKSVSEWLNVQKNIASYLMSDVVEGSDNKDLSSVLELSYHDLPFYLKPCFLYLGIFPEDYTISAERLYHLWEAEGLVTTSTYGGDEMTGVALDDIAESFLNQLVKRSMVQVEKCWPTGRIKSCRLHDVMRDLCLKKCKEVNFSSIIETGSSEGPSTQIVGRSTDNRKLHRCAIYLRGPNSFLNMAQNNSPSIRSLVIFPQGDICETELLLSRETRKVLSLVRVLDFDQGTYIPEMKKVKNFIHLRYLSIKGSRTWNMSSILDCKYLETLDLRSTRPVKISIKFWKLERLRHLYLPEQMYRSNKKLSFKTYQLQQMETFKNFKVLHCKTEDLGKLINMRVFTIANPEFLKVASCFTRESMEGLLESPMIKTKRLVEPFHLPINADVINGDPTILTTRVPDSCITGISISGEIVVELNDNVQIFPYYLTCVSLRECKIGEEGIRLLEKLPQLKKLFLSDNGTIVSKISFSKGVFTHLVKLHLWDLEKLEELVVEEEGALPNLQYLNIKFCMKLKKIAEGLPSSVHIECYPCVHGIEYYNTCRYFRNKS